MRLHTEADGTCGYCSKVYPRTPAWPCAPARVALDYVGGPPVDPHGLGGPREGYRVAMTGARDEPIGDAVDRAETIDEPERQEQPDPSDDPPVDPTDAGFPTSPELDDDDVVVTPPDDDGEPGAAAG